MARVKLSKKYKTYLFLAFIVFFGLALRLAFFSGIGTSDSLAYSEYSYSLSNGDYSPTEHQISSRIGLLLPVAVSYKIWGVNDFSSVLFILLTSMGGIILIFLFGKLLFDEKIGLTAAFLVSIFPLDVLYSTRLLSDLPAAFFAALSVFLFLNAEKIKSKIKTSLLYALSGISIGVAFSIREMAALTILFFGVYVLYKKRFKPSYFIVAAGFLAVFSSELLFFYINTGDALFRFHSLSGYYMDALTTVNYFGRLSFPGFFASWPYVIFSSIQLGYFYVFIFLAVFYWLFNKKTEINYILIWFLSFLLYLVFGTQSLTKYAPFLSVDRYLVFITIPGLLLLAAFLMEKKDIIKKTILPFSLIFLFFISIGTVYLDENRQTLNDLKETYDYIKSIDAPIYSDYRSIMAINYISEYNNNLNLIDLDSDPENIKNLKNAYIIINSEMIFRLESAGKILKFTRKISPIPLTWIKVKEIGKDENKIAIYYVS